ncbi:hypothetical protein ACFVQ4_20175 [Streptomyces laurentii]|uniref:hypothetical protein n=1 Tax=Streptomyces laurentii TaxID=39478 RepID=UPI0036B6EEAD
MDLSFYKSFISEEIRDEGRIEDRAACVMAAFNARGIPVPDHIRERITSCTDLDRLSRWHWRAATVSAAEDIFTAEDA